MLKNIAVENFKALEKVSFNIGHVTVFIGPNGSGKSSVLQALTLLKQSRQQLAFQLNGLYLNAGEFSDIVTGGSVGRRVTFKLMVDGAMPAGLTPAGDGGPFMCTYELIMDRQGPLSHTATYVLPDERSFVATCDLQTGRGRVLPPDPFQSVEISTGSLIGVPLYVTSGDQELYHAARELRDAVNEHLQNTFTVPVDRGMNSFQYPIEGRPQAELLKAGDVANYFAYASQEDRKQLNDWVREAVDEEVDLLFRLKGGADITIESHRREDINLAHEGAGLQHALWPLAQLVAAPNSSVIGIEDPELHLHPRAQANFSRVLVDAATKKDQQIIVTTQSEHLLMGFLTQVAEGRLKPDQLLVYYFERQAGISSAEPLPVDSRGALEGGLRGFYEANFEEMEKYLDARVRGRS